MGKRNRLAALGLVASCSVFACGSGDDARSGGSGGGSGTQGGASGVSGTSACAKDGETCWVNGTGECCAGLNCQTTSEAEQAKGTPASACGACVGEVGATCNAERGDCCDGLACTSATKTCCVKTNARVAVGPGCTKDTDCCMYQSQLAPTPGGAICSGGQCCLTGGTQTSCGTQATWDCCSGSGWAKEDNFGNRACYCN